MPNIGPKKAPIVSTIDKAPIWLKIGSHNTPIKKLIIPIIKPEDVADNLDGKKFINEYWEGMKFVIKFVDAVANKIKNKTTILKKILSNLPIISVGLTKIRSVFGKFWFKIISAPTTINTANIEKRIRLRIKLRFPFFNSFSFFTNLEKSPKLTSTIEK